MTLTYSFAWINGLNATYAGPDGKPYSDLNEPSATYHYGLNDAQQSAARLALKQWAAVANIQFVETPETNTQVGDIRFAWTSATDTTSSGSNAWGWANYPNSYWPSAGDVWLSSSSSSVNTPWTPGSYNFMSLLHEIGHTLGLKHTFEGSYRLLWPNDNRIHSVMSYTEAPHQEWVEVKKSPTGSYSWSASTIEPSTPMVDDILAIQYLYGANTTYNKGDNVYDFDPGTPFFQTLWDTGGQDTISAAKFTLPCTIDLNAGSYSSLGYKSNWDQYTQLKWQSTPDPQTIYDGTDNLGIAWGAVIENATGGSAADMLMGNASANKLLGGAGNDRLDGALGDDLLQGDTGNDTLTGGLGTDTAVYTSARSNYKVEKTATGWRVTDNASSDGTDTLQSIERLSFANRQIAIDLDGHAGAVARVIGAVFGETTLLTRPDYVGIGLYCMDTLGYSELTLSGIALAARLGNTPTPEQVVDLLYTNLMHQAPSAATREVFVNLLKSGEYTNSSLTDMAARRPENEANIQLTGLSNTGLDYVIYTPSA